MSIANGVARAVRAVSEAVARGARPLMVVAALAVIASLFLPWFKATGGSPPRPVEVGGWDALGGGAVVLAIACVLTFAVAALPDREWLVILRLLFGLGVYTLVLTKALDLPLIEGAGGVPSRPDATDFQASGRELGAWLASAGALLIVFAPLVELFRDRMWGRAGAKGEVARAAPASDGEVRGAGA
jgi:hypothetical protein